MFAYLCLCCIVMNLKKLSQDLRYVVTAPAFEVELGGVPTAFSQEIQLAVNELVTPVNWLLASGMYLTACNAELSFFNDITYLNLFRGIREGAVLIAKNAKNLAKF
jgi:hypothetical protein